MLSLAGGLNNLCAQDEEVIKNANLSALFFFRVFRLEAKLRIPATWENPATSLLWSTQHAQSLLCEPPVAFVTFGLRSIGARWENKTNLLSCHLDAHDAQRFGSLRSNSHGLCSFARANSWCSMARLQKVPRGQPSHVNTAHVWRPLWLAFSRKWSATES